MTRQEIELIRQLVEKVNRLERRIALADTLEQGETSATNIAATVHAATIDTTPLDADEVPGLDSSASFALVRWTWTSIKAFLKTYFDTLYELAGAIATHAALTATHGATGAVVGTTNTQTLTGKTLTSAILGGITNLPSGAATIATGAFTVTSSHMRLDTEAAAASDDLDTINGGTNGHIIILRTTNSGRDVVIKNGTGNIVCGADRTLNSIEDVWMGIFVSGANTWRQISFSDNA